MKILVLQDYLRSGGTERQALELTAGFRQAGEEAWLVTFRPGGVLKVPDEVRRVALQRKDFAWDWYAPGLKNLVRKESPDVVLAMGRMANCHLGLLPARHRVATFRTGKNLPYLFRRSLTKADHVVANSAEAAATLATRYGVAAAKISVIYNGLLARVPNADDDHQGGHCASPSSVGNPGQARQGPGAHGPGGEIQSGPDGAEHHRNQPAPGGLSAVPSAGAGDGAQEPSFLSCSRDPASRARARILLCVAMFRPEKNQRELIEIVSGLPTGPAWELWLAGDGPARAECEALAHRLKVADRVRFLGLVRDPRSLYREADIAVHASASEALSNFLIEAQAHGLPAVAYAAQGISETFLPNRTGWVIPPGDQAAFRATLTRLMTAPPPTLAAEAAAFARQRFDPAAQIESYLTLFRRLVAASP